MKTNKCVSDDHKSDDLCCSTHNRGFTIKTGTKHNQKLPMQKETLYFFISRVLEKLQTRSEPLEHVPKPRVDFHGVLDGLAYVRYPRAETLRLLFSEA